MTADRLIRFYPRAWRERYGAEFLEMIGPDALGAQQVIDISMGALDAWLSADVRRSAANASLATSSDGGRHMMTTLKAACGHNKVRLSPADTAITLAVFLGGTFLLAALGVALRRNGYPAAGEMFTSLAFPVCMTLSMPFSFLKGQPWRAQAVIVGGTVFFLILIGLLSMMI